MRKLWLIIFSELLLSRSCDPYENLLSDRAFIGGSAGLKPPDRSSVITNSPAPVSHCYRGLLLLGHMIVETADIQGTNYKIVFVSSQFGPKNNQLINLQPNMN